MVNDDICFFQIIICFYSYKVFFFVTVVTLCDIYSRYKRFFGLNIFLEKKVLA